MTPYEEIYDLFLDKIEDFVLKEAIVKNPDFATDELKAYLKNAIPKFTYSTVNLELRDDSLAHFNISLTTMEKEILSVLMVVEYLSPKILRSDLLENNLGSKDFRQYSPANQIKEVRELRETLKSEANLLMIEYYYRQGK